MNERTDAEILAHIDELGSRDTKGVTFQGAFFGFIQSDLVSYLSYEAAKPFLKDGVTPDQWDPPPRDAESIKGAIAEYMPFAWEKANNCRGLSAGRSLNHMQAWLWMLREEAVAVAIDDYSLYGKPQLRAICERFGIDWRSMDSGRWKASDYDDGAPAPAETIPLPWVPA